MDEKCVNIDKGITLSPEIRRQIRELIGENLVIVNANDKEVYFRNGIYSQYVKRFLDILIALIGLIITLPINIILAICTYFDVGYPLVFKQNRVGKELKMFTIIKFRNMNNKKDENGNLLPGKDRVTKFGKFVRSTSLDELLNFWSVLKGDMSIIGPRPLVTEYTDVLSERHKKRYLVRPGLECPMLYHSKGGKTWTDQFENDIWYIENISFWIDVKMTLALVKEVFNKKSSAMRGASVRGSFMGYNPDGTSINSQHVPIKYVAAVVKTEGGINGY